MGLIVCLLFRAFPGFFRKEARGKRRFAPYTTKESGKSFLVNFFLLERQYKKTPKGEEELPLMLAGLGKRSLSISQNMTHSEVHYLPFTNLCQVMSQEKNTHLRTHLDT